MEATQWTVQIYLTQERGDTTARAVLTTRDATRLTGTGHARRNPADPAVPGSGGNESPACLLLGPVIQTALLEAWGPVA